MSYRRFPLAFIRQGSANLEVQARVFGESNYEIYINRDGNYVSSDSMLEIINDQLDNRFEQVETLEVFIIRIRTDTAYIQSDLEQDHNFNVVVCVEDRYTNGHHM